MRERTRLKLARNSARNMIGIVDEYGILEYGQGKNELFIRKYKIQFSLKVFIQYTELHGDLLDDELGSNNDPSLTPQPEKTIILEQPVVVTKNPCHHPGDVRIFSAVDVPRLRHLKDVIVFPQRGKRPHPNEISGSDLDGKSFIILLY
jgi:RNA-dependent RNA polymerase